MAKVELLRYYVTSTGKTRGGWQVRRVVRVDGKEQDGGCYCECDTKAQAKDEVAYLNHCGRRLPNGDKPEVTQ